MGFLHNFGSGFAYIFGQVVPKTLSITNLAVSRYVKGENPSRPVDVRHSKTPLLKLPSVCDRLSFLSLHYAGLETTESLARICQMLPGNSSHPSLYPELDSVPLFEAESETRSFVSNCTMGLSWGRYRFFIGSCKDAQEKGSFGAKRSRGTKTRRTA